MDERLRRLTLRSSLSALADLLMPRVCIVCGRTLTARERHICLKCLADMPLTRFERWERNPMAVRYNGKISSFEPFQRAAALFFYGDSGYVNIPQGLKYGRKFAEGRYFAAMLGSCLADSPLFSDVDLVVPVPLHFMRKMRRGYNQAEVIAREVAKALGARMCPRLLVRKRRTRSQTKLSFEDKQANVAGAFAVRPWRGNVLRSERESEPASPHQTRKEDAGEVRHILIVDDVFTSGATLCACHDALRRIFLPHVRISVATLAVVPCSDSGG